MGFSVGQQVICVDASPNHLTGDASGLVKGARYTIHGIINDGVVLAEIPFPHVGYTGWYAWRFRAIIERKTDISVFTELLNPIKVKEDA